MLDSIHVGRWLEQFQSEEIDFLLYPSKKFRSIHPRIMALLECQSIASYGMLQKISPKLYAGFLDYLINVMPQAKFNLNRRASNLRRLSRRHRFDFIHCLEIQGAGYLLDEALSGFRNHDFKVIVTNYGSDIYYFKRYPNHLEKIVSVLKNADFYSAECNRDYVLAQELGFIGVNLPCIPNAGGFELRRDSDFVKPSERLNVIIKTYGGIFGRGDLAIAAVSKILEKFPEIKVLFFSVTEELVASIVKLQNIFPNRIRFATVGAPLDPTELKLEFLKSRVYVGCSVSDGISTSFLNALVSGTYPIQTDTSCANEWVDNGSVASIIPLDVSKLESEIEMALSNDALVDRAEKANYRVALKYLDKNIVSAKAKLFYIMP
jgi:glycosyltransferase involved in cell wall biosynthesis